MLATLLALAASVAAQSTVMRVDDAKAFNASTNRAGIQYSDGWTSDDEVGVRYHGTYTKTDKASTFLTLSFRGTSIAYYADKSSLSGPVMIALDGQSYPNVSWTNVEVGSTTYQQRMWYIDGLSPGDHQIVLGSANSHVNHTGIVGLDYFGITPIHDDETYVPENLGPGAFAVPVHAQIVDNEDSSITYSSNSWRLYGPESTGPTPLFFNGTQRSSTVPGASLTFTFTGTAVYYFSDDYWGNANVSISVDGDEGEVVSTATPKVTWMSQRLFWSKSGLTSGEHTVTITHVGRTGEYANLDFYMYLPSTSTPEPVSDSSKSVPVGTIVGAVVGGVAGLALILAGLFFLFRKRRAAGDDKEAANEVDQKTAGVHVLELKQIQSRGSEFTLDQKIGDEKAIA